MYAFVSNEYRAIVYTQRQLDFLCGIYSYPKFKMVNTIEEANQFFNSNIREFFTPSLNQYGKVDDVGYISIQYFIANNNIYANIFTKKFGFIKIRKVAHNVKQDASYDCLRICIQGVVLDNNLIAHHCLAINYILSLFDSNINVELILPDTSVYLACTKYKGKNFVIQKLQSYLTSRLGTVFYTIKRG